MFEPLDPMPLNPLIAEILDTLPIDLHEDWSERAAIMEHDGELPRAEAECRALLSVLRRFPEAIVGVTLLSYQLDGVPHWLLTTNLEHAGRHLAHVGAVEVVTTPLAQVVTHHCGGLATLVRAA